MKEILAVYFQFILPYATWISLHNLLCQLRWGQNSFILAQNWNVFFIFWIPDKAKKQFVTQYISTHFNISSLAGGGGGEKLLSRLRKQMFNSDREYEKWFLNLDDSFLKSVNSFVLIPKLAQGARASENLSKADYDFGKY